MGIYSDIREQQIYRESGGDDLDGGKGSLFPLSVTGDQRSPVKLRRCSACGTLIPFDIFNQHILERHNRDSIYLRINGRVILDGSSEQTFDGDTDLQLILPEDEVAQVTISFNDTVHEKVSMRGTGSLSQTLRELHEGKMQISVWGAGSHKTFGIIRRLQPPLNYRELDKTISKCQFVLDLGIEPDWSEFGKDLHIGSDSIDSERRYLRGFYCYSLAMWLDIRHLTQNSVRSHLEEAFTLLEPFDTTLATSALGILAIRMNQFRALERCRSLARLGLATRFFIDKDLPSTLDLVQHPSLNRDEALYVDGYLEVYLEALQAYYSSDEALLGRCLIRLSELVESRDQHDVAKYHLLQARALSHLGRREEARVCYRRLMNDPNFSDEAQEYLA